MGRSKHPKNKLRKAVPKNKWASFIRKLTKQTIEVTASSEANLIVKRMIEQLSDKLSDEIKELIGDRVRVTDHHVTVACRKVTDKASRSVVEEAFQYAQQCEKSYLENKV